MQQDFQGVQREMLASLVSKLLQSGGALDLKKWVAAIDLTADRAGFLLAHDLATAAEVMRATEDAASVPGEGAREGGRPLQHQRGVPGAAREAADHRRILRAEVRRSHCFDPLRRRPALARRGGVLQGRSAAHRARRPPPWLPPPPRRRLPSSAAATAPSAAGTASPAARPRGRRRTATSSSCRSTACARTCPGPATRVPSRRASPTLEKKAVSFTRAYSISSYTSMSLGGLLGGRIPPSFSAAGTSSAPTRTTSSSRSSCRRPASTRWASWRTCTSRRPASIRASTTGRSSPASRFDPNTDRDITSPQSEELAEKAPRRSGQRFAALLLLGALPRPARPLPASTRASTGARRDRDRYDGEVTFTDQYVGKLLDFIATRPGPRGR